MYAILLIFVVSFNLVSSDVANVQKLLERLDVLERKLEKVNLVERKLESNTKVIFNAQKTEGGNDVIGYLTFNRVDINIGDGFDGSSGIFKVPVTGIYKMSFSGQSAYGKIDWTYIRVDKNGFIKFYIYDGNDAEKGDENNVSYTWIMRLVKGDELKLNSWHYLYANSYEPLTFTGELIHIEN